MKHFDLSLIIACYNEEGLLLQSIQSITSVLDNTRLTYEIIFVDDKSKDGTRKIINNLTAMNSNFRYIFHSVNKGRGKTVKDGILAAKGAVVAYIDVDLEISPVYIPGFVRTILNGEADVVTGLRVYREGFFSIHRAILSKGYSLLVSSILNIPLKDTETGYKFFNRKKIIPILKITKNNGWFWDTEIMTFSFYKKLKILEEHVLFIRRFDKHSSVRLIPDTIDYLINLLKFRKLLYTKGHLKKPHAGT